MKLMIASDIHGSAYWCRALLEAFDREGAEKLLLLGDLLYHGPRNALPEEYDTKAVAAMLNARCDRLLCVRGNCDGEVDQMVLGFPILADYCLLYAEGRTILATHGHVFNALNPPPLRPGDVLLHGHTHVPAIERFGDGNLCLNPGSVSIPKNGSAHGYMLLEDGRFVWKDTDGAVTQSLPL